MPLGQGWGLDDTEQYRAQYDEYVLDDLWLEDQVEMLYLGLLRGPTGPPFAERLLSGYWYAMLPGPPQLMIFYSVDEAAQEILLESLRVAQPDE